jgi:hypothetical protein
MLQTIEHKFAKYLAIGLSVTTLIVIAGPVSDPVNVPKLLALGMTSFAMFPFLLMGVKKTKVGNVEKIALLTILVFLFIALLSAIVSKTPFTQNFYGTLGRNTGFLAYLFFSLIFVTTIQFNSSKSLNYLITGFMTAGAINVLYGIIERVFGDPIPWNNNYGALLGTFGNPDFAGAFYGLFAGVLFTHVLDNKRQSKYRICALLALILCIFCINATDTTQGVLVFLISCSVVLLIYLNFYIKNKVVTLTFLTIALTTGFLIFLGILQKGPLSNLLYKRSVSLRGIYWDAAIETGERNLLTGAGLDSFGNWYRQTRSLKAATWFPGPDVITNVAHNYYLDIFASGGIIFLASYSLITVIGFVSIIRILKCLEFFDPKATVLISLFLAFQSQAFISIPQIGLAVWGWVITGMLISYQRILATAEIKQKIVTREKNIQSYPVGLFAALSMLVGFIIALPPYSADAAWTKAINSQNLQSLQEALDPSYLTPPSSERLANASVILERNGLFELAHKYAIEGVKYNPHNFDAWKVLYYSTQSNGQQRKRALEMMRILDPLNRNLEKLP